MITTAILGTAVLLLLTVNLILGSALVRRVRPAGATGQARALPVVMLGSTIQALVAVASAADVRRAIDYWWDHRDLVDIMAKQFVEQQATRAGQIIDDSGQDLKSFIDSLPQAAQGAMNAQDPSLYGERDHINAHGFPTVDHHG